MKKTIVIEAMKFTRESYDELRCFTEDKVNKLGIPRCIDGKAWCYIETIGGDMKVNEGDFIIKGDDGIFHIFEPDIFNKTYGRFGNNGN